MSKGPSVWVKGLAIWLPVSLVNFSVVPPPLRVGFVASVSLGWLVCLSYLAPMKERKGEEP